eukprot:2784053-Amphidinium_carterae.1
MLQLRDADWQMQEIWLRVEPSQSHGVTLVTRGHQHSIVVFLAENLNTRLQDSSLTLLKKHSFRLHKQIDVAALSILDSTIFGVKNILEELPLALIEQKRVSDTFRCTIALSTETSTSWSSSYISIQHVIAHAEPIEDTSSLMLGFMSINARTRAWGEHQDSKSCVQNRMFQSQLCIAIDLFSITSLRSIFTEVHRRNVTKFTT